MILDQRAGINQRSRHRRILRRKDTQDRYRKARAISEAAYRKKRPPSIRLPQHASVRSCGNGYAVAQTVNRSHLVDYSPKATACRDDLATGQWHLNGVSMREPAFRRGQETRSRRFNTPSCASASAFIRYWSQSTAVPYRLPGSAQVRPQKINTVSTPSSTTADKEAVPFTVH